ncbi:hypothetical protein [Fluviispira sanaruensis]|uniref:Uncharacterized protein n=1 Tax=Fluviispira sanaruensis TaxID=2493639 RepID=A0A4P2VNT2_FLUSA|nr:hypothetical protein [Fluviispira sanaruensis]BBH54588.1 hypothetical protein JCM31447_30600 [Fluviispira sanaruensis]
MKKDESNKYNDIIDAEFVSEEGSSKSIPDSNNSVNEIENLSINPDIDYSSQNFTNMNQNNQFRSFSWTFSKGSVLTKNRPSILSIILLIPIFLVIFTFVLLFGLIAFVIFLPKLIVIIKRKGISGLKMDYKMIKGLFDRFKMK